MSQSCVGCKFLYAQAEGYSNYTVENTSVRCAKDLNDKLPADEPYDWGKTDNWPATMYGRCDQYSPGEYIMLDVDHEDSIDSLTEDEEQRRAISIHSGEPSSANPDSKP